MHFHEPSETSGTKECAKSIRWNARLGLWLFLFYTVLYAAFVLISAFSLPTLATPIAGIPLSIVAGLGLILGALLLSILYTWLCRSEMPAQQKN